MTKIAAAVVILMTATGGVFAAQENVPTAASMAANGPPDVSDVMEHLASADHVRALIDGVAGNLMLFTEDRAHPVRRFNGVPDVWLNRSVAARADLRADARPGEYFVFQVAVYAPRAGIGPIEATAGALRGVAGLIAADRVHCLSLGGVGPDGVAFKKKVSVPAGGVTPLWIGVDVPRDAGGDYAGSIIVSSGTESATANVSLHVSGTALPDGGVDDAFRLARLSWLDSTVGEEPTVTRPYTPVECDGARLSIRGHDLTLADTGLPGQIDSFYSGSNTKILPTAEHLLAGPATFVVLPSAGESLSSKTLSVTAHRAVDADWSTANTGIVKTVGLLEFDGSATIDCHVTATADTDCRDIRFELPLRKSVAKYSMGLGHFGGIRPAAQRWHWDADKFQDSLWIGDVNNGIQLRFKGGNYQRPPVNIYYPFRPLAMPDSWDHGGHGGIDVLQTGDDRVTVSAYTGPCHLSAGQTLHFKIDLLLTPFHTLDTDRHWADRYIHPFEGSGKPAMDKALATLKPAGPNIIELHHATYVNPYINYPFNADSFATLQGFVKQVHDRGARAKVYYTTRELTTNLPEFWALSSFDGEIILPGPGAATKTVINPKGPPAWMLAHLPGESYVPAWRAKIGSPYNKADYSVITTPDTRWNNFYLAGLQYLCDKADIDGLYIDDTALDHHSMQRARRILDTRPGRLVDLHSWNHNNSKAHFNDSAGVYMEIMPYLDRLWLGEGFDCNAVTPDYWLIQMAGVPYGLMADMLQNGGNPWLGMLFGETGRLGWIKSDPRPMWAAWDNFGMAGSDMIGWWDTACPVHTDQPNVLATVYHKPGRTMIAVGNFGATAVETHLTIDWHALGLTPCELIAPAIDKFQPGGSFEAAEPLKLDGKRGLLLVVAVPLCIESGHPII